MYLAIEIGGTKLQLGVGTGIGTELAAVEHREVDAHGGAAAILEQIKEMGGVLLRQHSVERIGIGFGGPVLSDIGRVIKSHQVPGWDNLPLADWCRETFGLPAVIGNDCDVAALAEASCGAGQGGNPVFYVTVGTGIGGGLVIDGRLHGRGRPAVAEIGHLRPGLEATGAERTVESLAAGPAIAEEARRRMRHVAGTDQAWVDDLLGRCHGDLDALTARMVGDAACQGNEMAQHILLQSSRVLGWAIAQVITLVAPEVVVVGGGVSMIGEEWFFRPLREQVGRYGFPPLADSFRIVPAELGQLVVVHGALALARESGSGDLKRATEVVDLKPAENSTASRTPGNTKNRGANPLGKPAESTGRTRNGGTTS